MKPSVLFIFSPFAGHLNKTTLLARYYLKKGAELTYLIHSEGTAFKTDFPSNVIFTKHFPVGQTRKTLSDDLDHKEIEVNPDEAFEARRNILIKVLEEVKPTLILMDDFCSHDYLLLYDYLKDYRTIIVVPWLPNLPGEGVPPMNSKRFPGTIARIEWLFQKITSYYRIYIDYYVNKEPKLIWLIKKLKNIGFHIPRYSLNVSNYPLFDIIEYWYMYPKELDFFERKLPVNKHYMGAAVDVFRVQPMPSAVRVFLKMVSISTSKTLIYCTFGTVVKTFVSKKTLLTFYTNLNQVAKKHPDWHILVSVTPDYIPLLRPSGMNILFATGVPQLEILKHSTVCINHGGGGTVLECVVAGVPMLCIPVSDKVDYNGNATRVLFHELGLTANFETGSDELEQKLQDLLSNAKFKLNSLIMSDVLQKNYGNDYLDRLDMPLA